MPPAPRVRQLEEACDSADIVVQELSVVAQEVLCILMLCFSSFFRRTFVKAPCWNFGSCSGVR